jgi:hypothetical protein
MADFAARSLSSTVRRRQLVEIEDLPWCPSAVRNGATDWLAFMANGARMFSPVAPAIRRAMDAVGTTHVLDLCSGGGGPWLTLEQELSAGGPATVELSDRYPNTDAFRDVHERSGGRVKFRTESIDATDVPVTLTGVRTMFNAFHHFPPETARAILADAVRKRRPIAIFEAVNTRAVGLIAIPLQVPTILLLTPFVRPFRWSRLFFTYILPLIPLLVVFDGTVSFLRLYLGDELRELVASVPDHESFEWDVGTTRVSAAPVGITHLVGVPKSDRPR